MTKKEWMLLALAGIIFSIILIISILIMFWLRHTEAIDAKQDEALQTATEKVVYEPIEEDQWFEVSKRFRNRNNVLEILEVHEVLKAQVDQLADSGMSDGALKTELRSIIEAYTMEQSREIAKDVLLEFVAGYSQWDMEYLMDQVNNSEKNEILYLYEIHYLEKKGFFIE